MEEIEGIFFQKHDYKQVFKNDDIKQTFKKTIKKIYDTSSNLKEFYESIDEKRDFMRKNFLIHTDQIETDFALAVEKGNENHKSKIVVSFNQEFSKEFKRQILRRNPEQAEEAMRILKEVDKRRRARYRVWYAVLGNTFEEKAYSTQLQYTTPLAPITQ